MRRGAATRIARAALPVLRRLDPEVAHDLGLAGLNCLRPLLPALKIPADLALRCFGLQFAHPVGLAAGFDKNGDYLDALGAVGFSHVELGTVTPRPQAGNPRPRMFRFAAQQALINRMGFNNKGVDHLVAQLKRSAYRGIRGVSIGKNADTAIEDAQEDYLLCFRKVYDHADYVAVNLSSPNTASLRDLQAQEGLRRVLCPLLEERLTLQARFGRKVPLLVKLAPDLTPEQVAVIARELKSLQIDGVIATNTSTDLGLLQAALPEGQRGGLSGAPLHALSVRMISLLRAELGQDFPIIGVGGILGVQQARESLRMGASLLQIYTGFAYRGAALLEELIQGLEEPMPGADPARGFSAARPSG